MPKLLRVQAAHPNTAHCEINKGYKIINGGFGKVNAIVTAQPILVAQAITSSVKRKGQTLKSALTQLTTPSTISVKESCPQFPK